MDSALLGFFFVLILLAIFTRETFVVILLYLFAGASLLGQWWVLQSLKQVTFHRKFIRYAFPGEIVPVQLDLTNSGILPVVWLRIQDYFPIEVADTRFFSQVITLGPKEKASLNYNLKARKRGYYTIGPFNITSGDLLGIGKERASAGGVDHLIVYPRVIAFSKVNLPSTSPLGTLPYRQPIFEDPTRPAGKRDYQAGDSIRRIDWKATAAIGRIQTKIFEPSIALDTTLFLNLTLEDYDLRMHFDATELAITVTASLANWVITHRQSAGLILNGFDPLSTSGAAQPLPSRKGRGQLMRILELLARIHTTEGMPFVPLLRQQRVHLPWGTTLVLVTGSAPQPLFDEVLQIKRSGLNPVLILCGEHSGHYQAAQQAKLSGLPMFIFRNEKDLDIWKGS